MICAHHASVTFAAFFTIIEATRLPISPNSDAEWFNRSSPTTTSAKRLREQLMPPDA